MIKSACLLQIGLLIFTTFPVSAAQTIVSGKIYEQDSNQSKIIFTSKKTWEGDHSKIETFDLNGTLLVSETGLTKGSQLLRYEVDQKQTSSKGTVEVKDGHVYFTRIVDGESKKDHEKLGATLVASSNFNLFVKDNWSRLQGNQDVDMRYVVWERLETVGFNLKKIGEGSVNGVKSVKLQMKPSSFIIAALVKPMYFEFSEDGNRLLSRKGRIPAKKKEGNDWKDIDADVFFGEPTSVK